jgi:GNAT superfamily N-acetyltransferase
MNETRLLLESDIPAAMRLNEAAGWNQIPADWKRLLALEPTGCFGIEVDGRLAATASAVCFGTRLAWIGMVLTHPEHRRKGLARRLMEHSLAYLGLRGVDWIKLDATDMGLPLYESLGFKAEAPIERWGIEAIRDFPAAAWKSVQPWSLARYVELDRSAFGADRSAILNCLASIEAASLPGGFAMSRPGAKAHSLGPAVARDPETARQLVQWLLSRHAGDTVFWDLLPQNRAAADLAGDLGFACRRKLVRMVRPGRAGAPPLLFDNSLVYAAAGFEYG